MSDVAEWPARTWMQYLRNASSHKLEEYSHTAHDVPWQYPERRYHLYIGEFRGHKQLTLIAAGTKYSYQQPHDQLGTRIATGKLPKMEKMLELYVQWL